MFDLTSFSILESPAKLLSRFGKTAMISDILIQDTVLGDVRLCPNLTIMSKSLFLREAVHRLLHRLLHLRISTARECLETLSHVKDLLSTSLILCFDAYVMDCWVRILLYVSTLSMVVTRDLTPSRYPFPSLRHPRHRSTVPAHMLSCCIFCLTVNQAKT